MPYCARGGIAANRHSVRHEIAERSIHLSVACLNLKQSCLTPGAIGGLALRANGQQCGSYDLCSCKFRVARNQPVRVASAMAW